LRGSIDIDKEPIEQVNQEGPSSRQELSFMLDLSHVSIREMEQDCPGYDEAHVNKDYDVETF